MEAAEIIQLLEIQCSILNETLSKSENINIIRKAYHRHEFVDTLKSLVLKELATPNSSSLDNTFVDSMTLNHSLGRVDYDEYSKATKYINETLLNKFNDDFDKVRKSFHAALKEEGFAQAIQICSKQEEKGTVWGFELIDIYSIAATTVNDTDQNNQSYRKNLIFVDEVPSKTLLPQTTKQNFLMRFICPFSYLYILFIGSLISVDFLIASIVLVLMDWFMFKMLRPWIEAYVAGLSIAPFYLNQPKYTALVRIEDNTHQESNWVYKAQRNLELVTALADCPVPNCGGKLLPKQKSLFSVGELRADCTNGGKQHSVNCDLHARVR